METEPVSIQTLLTAADTVRGRHERYGDCTDVLGSTMDMFEVYLRLKNGRFNAHDAAAFNIIQKLVRIGSGQNHADNWIDIAGYASLGAEVSE